MTAPPKVDAIDVAAVLAELEGRSVVSLPVLGERIGLDKQARAYAIREGLIETVPRPGTHGAYSVTADEARRLVLAAVLAIGAGVALAIMLRGVKGAGLSGEAVLAALEGAAAVAAASAIAARVVAT
jgi:hypothetical protein